MDSQPDEDQGDISLSLAAARTPTRRTSPSQPTPAIDLDVAVPQPKRLFLEPQRARGVSTDRLISATTNTHSRNESAGNDLSDDGATTPESITRKFWDGKASDIGPRPSSAQPPVSENPSQDAVSPFPAQPPARRTPSSLGRSRSLTSVCLLPIRLVANWDPARPPCQLQRSVRLRPTRLAGLGAQVSPGRRR